MGTAQPRSAADEAATGGSIEELLADGARRANAGDVAGALAAFNAVLRQEPRNFDAINNIGVAYCSDGRLAEGRPYIEKALALAPHDRDVRNNLTRLYVALLAQYFGDNDMAASLDIVRRHLVLDPPDRSHLRIKLMDILCRSGEKAQLSDFAPELKPDDLGRHLLVACMPKSGSSFLKEILRKLTGWREKSFVFAYMRNEQDLYLPAMMEVARSNTVTQQHCRATQPTIQLMQAFAMRPVILVRNIHDIVVSLAEFYDAGAVYNSFLAAGWDELDARQRLDAIIDHVMPWYLSFYASWVEACETGRIDGLVVTYEDMIADKSSTVAAIAGFFGLDKNPEERAAAVAEAEGNRYATRMNKGIAGRGASTLNEEQKRRVARLTEAYPSTDFSAVGL